MARIQIGGAGGAPSNNFIRSLRESHRQDFLIGTTCLPSDLFLADTDLKFVIPPAKATNYGDALFQILLEAKPDFLHLQHDFEVRAVSRMRQAIQEMGVKLYIPDARTVENCVDKEKSYAIWRDAGLRVPKTLLLESEADLSRAFDTLGGTLWIRATEGGGGRGAVPTDNFDFACIWIERFRGWGAFTASELLTERSVTWLSLWHEGELVVAQQRRRRSWNFGDRTLSGVTGITGVGETSSDTVVDRVALDAIGAVDGRPHGIFAVDMTYDASGFPNPTEINIGRFFTTHYFFTRAGLNLPAIYCDIALEGKFPVLPRTINPLPDGLIWIRGMDVEPVLTTAAELEKFERSAK